MKKLLNNILGGSLIKDLGNVLQIFKDNKGRFSSKRTVAGVIVAMAATDASNKGQLEWMHLAMCGVAAAIIILAPVVEKHTKDEYKEK